MKKDRTIALLEKMRGVAVNSAYWHRHINGRFSIAPCDICGQIGERSPMLKDEIFNTVTEHYGRPDGNGKICPRCIETALNRKIEFSDITNTPLSVGYVVRNTEALKDTIKGTAAEAKTAQALNNTVLSRLRYNTRATKWATIEDITHNNEQ